jgi:hypothetical protein
VRRHGIHVDELRAVDEMIAQEGQVLVGAGEAAELSLADVAEVARRLAAVLGPIVVLPWDELRLAQSDSSSSRIRSISRSVAWCAAVATSCPRKSSMSTGAP